MKRTAILQSAALVALKVCLIASVVVISASCATERKPINRVQANALDKSYFVRPNAAGEYRGGGDDSDSWYFLATVTDTPVVNRFTKFIGWHGQMFRIKWRVEETQLLAFREDPDILGSADESGGLVAAFPIDKHFDIRRSYNSVTGEELNIVEENTQDRLWHQRQYMRVDWSKNHLANRSLDFRLGETDTRGYEANYFVQDPNDADHPVFEDGYFDITANYTLIADWLSCYTVYRSRDCSDGDVRARLSFRKVPERDYVPREYPDRQPILNAKGQAILDADGREISLPVHDQFGLFRTERAVTDSRFGTLEKQFIYRAHLWNIWQEWFARDGEGEIVKEGGLNKLLPFKERKIRPVVYHLNSDFPAELKSTMAAAADQFDDAFQEAVASTRLMEYKGDGAVLEYAELRAEVAAMKARGERVVFFCTNSPVIEGDPVECGPPGTVARIGDLRYSIINWVTKPSYLLGFGPSFADPITGEMVSAATFLYGTSIDSYAQRAVEMVNLITGRTSGDDFLHGVDTDRFAQQLKDARLPGPTESAVVGAPANVPGTATFNLAAAQTSVDATFDRSLMGVVDAKAASKELALGGATPRSNPLARLRGSQFEDILLNSPEMKQLFDKSDNEALSDNDVKTLQSHLFGASTDASEREREQLLGTHGCHYMAEFADGAIIGLAQELAKKYPKLGNASEDAKRETEMWQEIRRAITRGVGLHETGHNIGPLRHNFEGSSDALNFFDEYWELRGDKANFGDKLTDEQNAKRISEYEYSSIMDYGARFNSDIHDLGKYDYAAIRFAYANMVEAWPSGKVIEPLYTRDPGYDRLNTYPSYSADLLEAINRTNRHYTQIPKQFSDGLKSLSRSGRQIRRFEDVVANATALYRNSANRTHRVRTGSWAREEGLGIDVVPYRWCGDEYAGTAGRPMCQRWDRGADAFEVVHDAMTQYKQNYLFDAFTRGRVGSYNFQWGYFQRVLHRYFSHVHRHYANWYYFRGQRQQLWDSDLNRDRNGVAHGYISDPDWLKDPNGGLPGTLAARWGLDQLINVLSTPPVGRYVFDEKSKAFRLSSDSTRICEGKNKELVRCPSDAKSLTLEIDDGARYLSSHYDNASGSSRRFNLISAGAVYDRIAAMITLTRNDAVFIGVDKFNKPEFDVGFYNTFPKKLTELFGGFLNDSYNTFAWRYEPTPKNELTPRLLSRELFGSDENVATFVKDVDPYSLDPNPTEPELRGLPISPITGIYMKAFAMTLAMARFQSAYSQSWNDAARIWLKGNGDSFTPAADAPLVSFTDPFSHRQFEAVVYGDGRSSPAADMIRKGDELRKQYEEAVETARTALPAGKRTAEDEKARVEAQLKEHVNTVDLMRGLHGLLWTASYRGL